MSLDETMTDETMADEAPIVTYNDVQKRYGEGGEAVRAVDEFSADIEDSEFVSIVGPSGCGKSTLLHLTAGILDPTHGSVTVSGMNVQSSGYEKHNVGLIFQKPVLLEWRTVLDNVLLPVEIMAENGVLTEDRSYYEERARELLGVVDLGGFEDAYPRELSGGMQQRASICRSLVYDPPILLMDEPFGALDKITRDQLNDELLSIWAETDKTIVFVTHNIQEAIYLSDRVIVLSDRPASVLDTVAVDLARPRNEETLAHDRYQELVAQVTKTMELRGRSTD